jgi:hypothetical protein
MSDLPVVAVVVETKNIIGELIAVAAIGADAS